MASWYNTGLVGVLGGSVRILTDSIKAMLVGPGYVFDPDHTPLSAISAYEVSGTGYTAGFDGSGRKLLTGKSVGRDDSSDLAHLDADNLAWSAINVGAVAGVVLYKPGTSDANSIPVIFVPAAKLTNGSGLSLAWAPEGVARLIGV